MTEDAAAYGCALEGVGLELAFFGVYGPERLLEEIIRIADKGAELAAIV